MNRSNTRVARATLLALALTAAFAAHAQTAPPQSPINDLDALRQFEERERLEQQIQRELEEQQRRDREAAQQPAPALPGIPDLGGNAFRIDRIFLQGEPRPPSSRRKILASFEHRDLGATQLLELVRALTNDFARQGHVTTTVVFKPQNLKTGQFVLDVQWGRAKGWRFKGHSAKGLNERALLAMLPPVAGDVLDSAAIDQAVEILNNGRQSATVNIAPADETGYSWLDITVQPRFPFGGNVNVDNSGPAIEPGDGRLRSTLGTSVRGIGAETWTLGATKRHYFDGYKADEDSRNVSVNLPFGYFDVEFRYGDSKYERLQRSMFGSYSTYGNSTDQSLKLGWTATRSKEGKTDLTLRINRKDNENYIEGTKLDVNSKVYTDLVLGLSRVEQLWGGSLYADAQWTRGTQWLGANDVTIYPIGVTPALYYKYSGNLSWSRGFALGARRIDLGLRSGWQWTSRNLLTANTLSIGDEYTVRGFKGNGAFGDKGGYLSTTLTVPIAAGWSAFTGIDYGAVENNLDDARLQELSGWAVGLRGNWRNASVSLMHAQPRTSPTDAKDPVLYGMASLRF